MENVRRDAGQDLIVVGSGAAGLATAIMAHERRLDPIVIEKSDLLGGGTSYSYGLIWAGANPVAAEAGYVDPAEDVEAYMRFLASGQAVEARLRAFVDRTPEAISFLRQCGLELRVVHGLTDHHYDHAPGSTSGGRTLEAPLIDGHDLSHWQDGVLTPPIGAYRLTAEELVAWGGMNAAGRGERMHEREEHDRRGLGVGLISNLLKILLQRGVHIEAGVGVEQLLTDGGRITGVQLADGRQLHSRHGVVLATGGYDSNDELAHRFEGLPRLKSMFPPSVTGDGLVMAAEVGASIATIHNSQQLFLGFDVPLPDGRRAFHLAGIIELCSPHTMVVNASGRRFANEAHFQHVAPLLRRFDGQTRSFANLPSYLIFDRQYAERYSFAGQQAAAPIPDWVDRADTLAELAASLDVDASGLKDTAARFNAFAAAGADHDFGRGTELWRLGRADDAPTSRLGAISEPPFYGIELHPSAPCASGLAVDEDGRVLHVRGHAIEGLYAIGNCAVHSEFGIGYQHGLTLASGLCFGYLAVEAMRTPDADLRAQA